MPHRAHLFSLRIGNALRESCWQEKYTLQRFYKDVLAGITVGIIAIPLAMALAIASGVAPQFQPLKTLRKANLAPINQQLMIVPTLGAALGVVSQWKIKP